MISWSDMQYEVSIDASLCDFNPLRVCLQRASMRDPLKMSHNWSLWNFCGSAYADNVWTTSAKSWHHEFTGPDDGSFSSYICVLVFSMYRNAYDIYIYI